MKIGIVVGSIRNDRVTNRLASWVEQTASQQVSEHNWQLIDIKDYNLPMFDEYMPPMAERRPELADNVVDYLSAMGDMDAYVFVTPEYNHGMPSALKNAIDLLDFQLIKKPVAIVSHGVVGGARANEQLRLVLGSNLGAVPISNSLTFAGQVSHLIDESGQLLADSDSSNVKSLQGVIEAIVWYGEALLKARVGESTSAVVA